MRNSSRQNPSNNTSLRTTHITTENPSRTKKYNSINKLRPNDVSVERYGNWELSHSDLIHILRWHEDPITRHEAAFVLWTDGKFHHQYRSVIRHDHSSTNVHETLEAIGQCTEEDAIEWLNYLILLCEHWDNYCNINTTLNNLDIKRTIIFAVENLLSNLEHSNDHKSNNFVQEKDTVKYFVRHKLGFETKIAI